MAGLFEPQKQRKPFKMSTKKIEWMLAAGRDPKEYAEKSKFYKTSYCRKCKTKLIWGDGSYNFRPQGQQYSQQQAKQLLFSLSELSRESHKI